MPDAISPRFRLRHSDELRPLNFNDVFLNYSYDSVEQTIFHRPSKLLFQVFFDREPRSHPIQATEIELALVHACEGATVPPIDKLKRIALTTIHYVMIDDERCWTNIPCNESDVDNDDDIPF